MYLMPFISATEIGICHALDVALDAAARTRWFSRLRSRSCPLVWRPSASGAPVFFTKDLIPTQDKPSMNWQVIFKVHRRYLLGHADHYHCWLR